MELPVIGSGLQVVDFDSFRVLDRGGFGVAGEVDEVVLGIRYDGSDWGEDLCGDDLLRGSSSATEQGVKDILGELQEEGGEEGGEE